MILMRKAPNRSTIHAQFAGRTVRRNVLMKSALEQHWNCACYSIYAQNDAQFSGPHRPESRLKGFFQSRLFRCLWIASTAKQYLCAGNPLCNPRASSEQGQEAGNVEPARNQRVPQLAPAQAKCKSGQVWCNPMRNYTQSGLRAIGSNALTINLLRIARELRITQFRRNSPSAFLGVLRGEIS
jgi:hypothetical protein